MLDEIELYVNSKINQDIKESDISNFDIKSSLGQQSPNQQLKVSGWRFDKIIR